MCRSLKLLQVDKSVCFSMLPLIHLLCSVMQYLLIALFIWGLRPHNFAVPADRCTIRPLPLLSQRGIKVKSKLITSTVFWKVANCLEVLSYTDFKLPVQTPHPHNHPPLVHMNRPGTFRSVPCFRLYHISLVNGLSLSIE